MKKLLQLLLFAISANQLVAQSTCNNNSLYWTGGGNTIQNQNTNALGTCNNFDLIFKTNDTARITIKSDGRLFIGGQRVITSHPHSNAFFQVNGKIACKELVVVDPAKWADFVFANNYKLRSLEELEKYYKQNKHLPDIPAEKEIKQNGINSAEMDALLLQKIEELTLYVVELSKKLDEVKKENENLNLNLNKR